MRFCEQNGSSKPLFVAIDGFSHPLFSLLLVYSICAPAVAAESPVISECIESHTELRHV